LLTLLDWMNFILIEDIKTLYHEKDIGSY
jgi:hypothetical protein